ncbi:MAG: carbohydrate-binding family 9-like protein [Bacteroidota bacterium]
MKSLVLLLGILFHLAAIANKVNVPVDTPLLVHRCNDFIITGKGDNAEWDKTKWTSLTKLNQPGKEYKTKFKILYSAKGIYVLFNSDDEKIGTEYKNDFENLFTADVVEVFFHPEPAQTTYFEYEVSPLEYELVLLILNTNGKFGSWMPWHYEDKKKVIKKVNIIGGEMKPGASIQSWSAELFFPFQLLSGLLNTPPVSGTRWNANFCRLDYDTGNQVMFSWSPVRNSFHEFKKYYSLQFE